MDDEDYGLNASRYVSKAKENMQNKSSDLIKRLQQTRQVLIETQLERVNNEVDNEINEQQVMEGGDNDGEEIITAVGGHVCGDVAIANLKEDIKDLYSMVKNLAKDVKEIKELLSTPATTVVEPKTPPPKGRRKKDVEVVDDEEDLVSKLSRSTHLEDLVNYDLSQQQKQKQKRPTKRPSKAKRVTKKTKPEPVADEDYEFGFQSKSAATKSR